MRISTSGPVINSKSTTFQGVCMLGQLRDHIILNGLDNKRQSAHGVGHSTAPTGL